MNKLHDISSSGVQSFFSPSYPCQYLPNRQARMQIATPNVLITFQVYSNLVQLGFGRAGTQIFRPNCEGCQACVPVRIDVANFKYSRIQRYTWKHHSSLEVAMQPLEDVPGHFELYQRYMLARHSNGDIGYDLRKQYLDFLMAKSADSRIVEFREDGILRMVSIIDLHTDGVSVLYIYYEPFITQSSYGTYCLLWMVEWSRQMKLGYVYLSYWIEQGTKLSYKSNFYALQGLVNDTWQPIPRQSSHRKSQAQREGN